MAEPQYTITADGQEVQGDDLSLLGQVSGLADDRVLAELLRLAPFTSTVAKAIVPYGLAKDNGATVQPSGNADGKCRVMPFRAITGSVDTVANIGALANWRDIRSGVYAVSDDGSTLGHLITFAANASGSQTRWDLVYAAVARDANGPSVTRYNKPASGAAVVPTTIPQYLTQSITIGVVTGTVATSPVFPALPSDAAGTYYIPLAYVAIKHNFTATSTIPAFAVYDAAPTLPIARETGAASLRVADQSNAVGGTVYSSTNWQPNTGWISRPGPVVPPSMVGSEELFIALDLTDATASNWSHGRGSIVDQSCDWGLRLFTSYAVAAGASVNFAWDNAAVSVAVIPGESVGSPFIGPPGQSFQNDASLLPTAPTGGTAFVANAGNMPNMASGSQIALYVDYTTPGNPLRLFVSTTVPLARFVIWLRATAPFPNY